MDRTSKFLRPQAAWAGVAVFCGKQMGEGKCDYKTGIPVVLRTHDYHCADKAISKKPLA